jgi:hypothetical protein
MGAIYRRFKMEGTKRGSWFVFLGAISVILCLTLSCGCIEVGSEETPHSANSQPTPAWTPVQSVPYVMPGASEPLQHAPVTPAPGPTLAGTVVYTEPIPPSIAMNFSYRNLPSLPDSLPLPFDYPTAPFFSATYDLKWDNIALLAQPSAPPFVIEMEFVAGTNNPYDARASVTVRNNQTGEIVAEDGFNGEFSSEREKMICIRKGGEYHVNIYGYRTTVTLVLREGVDEDKAVPYEIYGKKAGSYYYEVESGEE